MREAIRLSLAAFTPQQPSLFPSLCFLCSSLCFVAAMSAAASAAAAAAAAAAPAARTASSRKKTPSTKALDAMGGDSADAAANAQPIVSEPTEEKQTQPQAAAAVSTAPAAALAGAAPAVLSLSLSSSSSGAPPVPAPVDWQAEFARMFSRVDAQDRSIANLTHAVMMVAATKPAAAAAPVVLPSPPPPALSAPAPVAPPVALSNAASPSSARLAELTTGVNRAARVNGDAAGFTELLQSLQLVSNQQDNGASMSQVNQSMHADMLQGREAAGAFSAPLSLSPSPAALSASSVPAGAVPLSLYTPAYGQEPTLQSVLQTLAGSNPSRSGRIRSSYPTLGEFTTHVQQLIQANMKGGHMRWVAAWTNLMIIVIKFDATRGWDWARDYVQCFFDYQSETHSDFCSMPSMNAEVIARVELEQALKARNRNAKSGASSGGLHNKNNNNKNNSSPRPPHPNPCKHHGSKAQHTTEECRQSGGDKK